MRASPALRSKISGTALLAILLALASLQLTYAGHQFKHDAGDFSVACTVCAQLDRFDQSLTEAPPAFEAPAIPPLPATVAFSSSPTRAIAAYLSRAPPLA
jgi:hypothetical protein